MNNYRQRGETLTFTAPTGGVESGDLLIVGELAGVAVTDADEGAEVETTVYGVFELPKKAVAITTGAALYAKASDTALTTSATGNKLIGYAIKDAADSDPTVEVLIR